MSSEFIPLSIPHLAGNEWRYIKECLDTNWVSYLGPFVERFERELAAKVGAQYAVATASGTAALHIALLLAGVGPDDEVVMPAITFVAPANAVRYCGAWPTFVDIGREDWQVDVGQLATFLESCEQRASKLFNRATGRRVAALLPVHLLGGMADVDALAELATRYNLPLVEDAAECLGATYKGRSIGAPCQAPQRFVITSFNGNKIITTGSGGAIFTNDSTVASRAKHLMTTAKADKIDFFHDVVGYNYRLTNVAAAMGVAQLEQLDRYVEIKRGIAARHAAALPVTPQPEPAHCQSTFWMYSLWLDQSARPVIDRLNAAGIQSRPIWVPLHRLPSFQQCHRVASLTVAEDFYARGLSLPCSVGLTEADQEHVCRIFRLTLQEITR